MKKNFINPSLSWVSFTSQEDVLQTLSANISRFFQGDGSVITNDDIAVDAKNWETMFPN